MVQPRQRCVVHKCTATFVNVKNGDLLCDLDDLLFRGSPLHDALRPLAEVDLASLAPKLPPPPTQYLLQVWPAPTTPPAILRTTSRHAAYWQSTG